MNNKTLLTMVAGGWWPGTIGGGILSLCLPAINCDCPVRDQGEDKDSNYKHCCRAVTEERYEQGWESSCVMCNVMCCAGTV